MESSASCKCKEPSASARSQVQVASAWSQVQVASARSQEQVASARSQVQLTCEELKSLLRAVPTTLHENRPSAGIGVVEVQKLKVFYDF